MTGENGKLLVCPRCGSVYIRDIEFCGIDGEKLVETLEDPLIGREIDRLEITDLLGQGGMARVYLAQHRTLDRKAAIKILLGDLGADRSLVKRFEREAVALSKLNHPNIVEVTDFGRTPDGLVFIVMEYLKGHALIDVLKEQKVFSQERAANITRQTALALQSAHEQGFVHRDLKPGNIMLLDREFEEVVKILDFGIVGLLEKGGSDHTELTMKGQFVGTPAYISPEQVSGKAVSPASDLYSLGVILYRLVVGKLPFTGEVVELAHAHVKELPPRPPPECGELGELALALMAKKPEDRPSSGAEVVRRIERMNLTSHLPQRPSAPVSREEDFLMVDLQSERPDHTVNMRGEVSLLVDESVVDMNSSINAALGQPNWFLRILLAVVVLAGVAAGADEALYSGMYRARVLAMVDELRGQAPGEAPPPSPPPVETPPPAPDPKANDPIQALGDPAAKPDPEPKVDPEPKAKAKTREKPPKRKPLRPPKTGPDGDDAMRKALERLEKAKAKENDAQPGSIALSQLDKQLRTKLFNKGLNWTDLESLAPDKARTWSSWVRKKERPPGTQVEELYQELQMTVTVATIDLKLLNPKLRRVRRLLDRLQKVGVRAYRDLDARYVEIKRLISFNPPAEELIDLMSQTNRLERDVRVALTRAQKK